MSMCGLQVWARSSMCVFENLKEKLATPRVALWEEEDCEVGGAAETRTSRARTSWRGPEPRLPCVRLRARWTPLARLSLGVARPPWKMTL